MFLREMKVNLKSFLIWLGVLIGIFLVVFLIYPYMFDQNNMEMFDEMMAIFPEEFLKAFNMDIASIDTVFGWIKTEGFVFILLIIGSYASILGSNILLKEESDETIEYLNTLPVTRSKIVLTKFLCGICYVFLMVLGLGIFNYIGLALSGDFDQKSYLLLSITPLFPALVFFSLSMFLATFTHKTKKMVGISLGIVFISYILQTIASVSDNVSFLKYFSIFTLSDTRYVIENSSLNPMIILISLMLIILFLGLTLIHYNKKELI